MPRRMLVGHRSGAYGSVRLGLRRRRRVARARRRRTAGRGTGDSVRPMLIATWNVNSLNARMPRVEEWLADGAARRPVPAGDQADRRRVPRAGLRRRSATSRPTTARGSGTASPSCRKVGIDDVGRRLRRRRRRPTPTPASSGPPAAACGSRRCYVPNGRELDHDHYRYKLRWLGRLRAAPRPPRTTRRRAAGRRAATATSPPTTSTCGTRPRSSAPPTSAPPEREALAERRRRGASSTSSASATPTAGLYSYWDYRAGDFHKRRACASTSSWPPRRSPTASTARARRPQRPQGQEPGPRPVFIDLAEA